LRVVEEYTTRNLGVQPVGEWRGSEADSSRSFTVHCEPGRLPSSWPKPFPNRPSSATTTTKVRSPGPTRPPPKRAWTAASPSKSPRPPTFPATVSTSLPVSIVFTIWAIRSAPRDTLAHTCETSVLVQKNGVGVARDETRGMTGSCRSAIEGSLSIVGRHFRDGQVPMKSPSAKHNSMQPAMIRTYATQPHGSTPFGGVP